MRRLVNKIPAIFICIGLLISLVACNTTTNTTTTAKTTSTTTAPAATTTVSKDPFGKYSPEITINTVRSLDSNVKFDSKDPDTESLTSNIWSKAYKEKLGITLNYLWTPNGDQYNTKWNTAIASGEIPDMGVVDRTIYKMLLKGNLVEDCTQVFNDYASDYYKSCMNKETGDNGIAIKVMTFDKKLLGIPCPGAAPEGISLLWLRKDWLKKVNLAEPKSIEELVTVAKAFKAANLGGAETYGLFISKDVSSITGFLNGYGAYYNNWFDDGSGKLVYGTIQAKMKEPLLRLQQLYKEGLIRQDFSVLDSTKAGQDIAAGKTGITYGGVTHSLSSIKDSITGDTTSDWEVIPIPTLDGAKPKPQASATPGSFIFVRKGYKYPEAAVKVMNLNLDLFTKDPDHYATRTDGLQTLLYRFASEAALPWKNLKMHLAIMEAIKTNDTSKLTPEQILTHGRVVGGMKGEGDRGTNITRLLIFGEKGSYSILNVIKNEDRILVDAFQSLPTETMTTLSSTIQTNLDTAILKIIMGADIATFDTAVAEWKKSGGDQITKEVNDWYAKSK